MFKDLDINKLSFEAAAEHLETIIKNLEGGKVSLEQSVEYYKQGIVLKDHCLDMLKSAEETVEKILIQKDGTAIIENFDSGKS